MNIPEDLKYTKEHEWVSMDEANLVTVGITDFAQSSLGDITFVELPEEGTEIKKDDPFGVVESVKAVSDIYAPVNGRVVETNSPLLQTPELLNDDPYTDGWLIKVELPSDEAVKDTMDAEEYRNYIEVGN